MKKIIYLSILCLVISACVSKYEVVLPDTPKTLVINGYLTNNISDSAGIQISQAVSTLSQDWPAPDATGAVVALFENGTKVKTLFLNQIGSNNLGFTTNGFMPKAGKTYRVEAKFKDFDAVSAEQVMPTDMPIFTARYRDSISFANGGGTRGGSSNAIAGVDISFVDNGSTTDYYEIQVYTQDSIDTNGDGINDVLSPPIQRSIEPFNNVGESVGSIGSGSSLLLSDQTFNGQRISFSVLSYELRYGYNYYNPGAIPKRSVRLTHITQDRYLYLKSKLKQDQSGVGLLVEPVYVYSNVSNKFGIFLLGNGRLQDL